MKVIRLANNVYDVFAGNGWDNWSRIRTSKSGPFVVAGNKMPYAALRKLNDALKPSAPTSFNLED